MADSPPKPHLKLKWNVDFFNGVTVFVLIRQSADQCLSSGTELLPLSHMKLQWAFLLNYTAEKVCQRKNLLLYLGTQWQVFPCVCDIFHIHRQNMTLIFCLCHCFESDIFFYVSNNNVYFVSIWGIWFCVTFSLHVKW